MPEWVSDDTILARLLDLVFPPRCVGCGARGAVLCATCWGSIHPPEAQACAHCDRPLPITSVERGEGLCARCQTQCPVRVGLAGLRVAARYEGPVRQAIRALKYQGQRRLAPPLASLLVGTTASMTPAPAVIVPVPLHPSRMRQRGYNQSDLLARHLSRAVHLPVRSDLLARVRPTPPQVGLSAAARRVNVAGAFAATSRAVQIVPGQHLLLVDDVCTSGATLAAAAEALCAVGARSVWGIAVARPSITADVWPERIAASTPMVPSQRLPLDP